MQKWAFRSIGTTFCDAKTHVIRGPCDFAACYQARLIRLCLWKQATDNVGQLVNLITITTQVMSPERTHFSNLVLHITASGKIAMCSHPFRSCVLNTNHTSVSFAHLSFHQSCATLNGNTQSR